MGVMAWASGGGPVGHEGFGEEKDDGGEEQGPPVLESLAVVAGPLGGEVPGGGGIATRNAAGDVVGTDGFEDGFRGRQLGGELEQWSAIGFAEGPDAGEVGFEMDPTSFLRRSGAFASVGSDELAVGGFADGGGELRLVAEGDCEAGEEETVVGAAGEVPGDAVDGGDEGLVLGSVGSGVIG